MTLNKSRLCLDSIWTHWISTRLKPLKPSAAFRLTLTTGRCPGNFDSQRSACQSPTVAALRHFPMHPSKRLETALKLLWLISFKKSQAQLDVFSCWLSVDFMISCYSWESCFEALRPVQGQVIPALGAAPWDLLKGKKGASNQEMWDTFRGDAHYVF